MDEIIQEWVELLKATSVIICLTSKTNFRYQVLPSYKSNRKDVVRPVLLTTCKEYLAEHYPTYERDGLEADDVMGILSTHPTLVPGKKIIVSSDKDMKTIPGFLFNPEKHTKEVYVGESIADEYWLEQTLTGDTTDGYKGCPGIGKVKAQAALCPLETLEEMWQAVVQLYEFKGLTEEDALVQARVARILRHTDYNFKTKEVILWRPVA